MLLHLTIENFILIPHLEVRFDKGFTCITGETGAGKSIVVGALLLILGQRADSGVLREADKKCVVEGAFSVKGYGLEPIFESYDLDYEDISVFRREISPVGKSRAFINDTPVNLNVLKEFGDRLVDIHSQHQTLEINEAAFQLGMVDSYAANHDILIQYGSLFSKYNRLKSELNDCIVREQQSQNEREYLEFQYEELEKANLQVEEQVDLEEELEILTHAEDIKLKTFSALDLISDSDTSILGKLGEVKQLLDQAARYNHHLEPLNERLNQTIIEIKDVSGEIRTLSDQVHFDPQRISFLTERLNLIYHLEQKHHKSSVDELIAYKQQISDKLLDLTSLKDKIDKIGKLVEEHRTELFTLSAVLSKNRSKVIPDIEARMTATLEQLGMPAAVFSVKNEELKELTSFGTDKVSFLFTANKGGEMREIQKVASGGELSRLMLAVKSLITERRQLPTILFDEIDSGVSGEIAGKVGNIMRSMSEKVQVIAITHLPQIAGKSDSHLLAVKNDDGETSVSSLVQLTDDERIIEIARMLSDETITETAKLAARELLNYRN